MKKLEKAGLALKYIAKKKHHALDWNSILLGTGLEEYSLGQIHLEYQISFDDLLQKYNLNASPEDVKLLVKGNKQSISDIETRYICSLVSGTKAEKIFEIGTFLGDTTVNLAYNIENTTKIFTLDRPQEKCKFTVGKSITEHQKLASKITQFHGDSKTFDFSPFHNQIDIMFIDGNHNYDYVLNDSEKALECVKPQGFIVWHDFDALHIGSSRAIIEFCKKHNLDLNKISITPLAITQKNGAHNTMLNSKDRLEQ